ncbi:hypothetical protein ACFVUS_08470 [Nocardia sp. NPDC058058]|uniref:hypothetical protein n=1 Tax=Nocardia sp. NPDC058058 TaxID=3346317 RepID=UPI0036DEBADB
MTVIVAGLIVSVATGCGHDAAVSNEPAIDRTCMYNNRALLEYNLLVQDRKTKPIEDSHMLPYLDSNGNVIPFDAALQVDNPSKDPRLGNDKLATVGVNYLNSQGFPGYQFNHVYMDLLGVVTDGRATDGRIYYTLAQQLRSGTDEFDRPADRLPESEVLRPYLDERGALVGYDRAVTIAGGDQALATVFGQYFRDVHIPADILVSTYQTTYDSCLKQKS